MGLALHWLCVIDFSGLTTYMLKAVRCHLQTASEDLSVHTIV